METRTLKALSVGALISAYGLDGKDKIKTLPQQTSAKQNCSVRNLRRIKEDQK